MLWALSVPTAMGSALAVMSTVAVVRSSVPSVGASRHDYAQGGVGIEVAGVCQGQHGIIGVAAGYTHDGQAGDLGRAWSR